MALSDYRLPSEFTRVTSEDTRKYPFFVSMTNANQREAQTMKVLSPFNHLAVSKGYYNYYYYTSDKMSELAIISYLLHRRYYDGGNMDDVPVERTFDALMEYTFYIMNIEPTEENTSAFRDQFFDAITENRINRREICNLIKLFGEQRSKMMEQISFRFRNSAEQRGPMNCPTVSVPSSFITYTMMSFIAVENDIDPNYVGNTHMQKIARIVNMTYSIYDRMMTMFDNVIPSYNPMIVVDPQSKKPMLSIYGSGAGDKLIYKTVKIGKGVKEMFPFLKDDEVTFFSEVLSKNFAPDMSELFVHEGDTREHFRIGYMGKIHSARTTIPFNNYIKSLASSCQRHQVIKEGTWYDANAFHSLKFGSVNGFSPDLRDNGIHPAECYASGSYKIVYVTNKPDPLDPEATIYARQMLMRIDLNYEDVDKSRYFEIEGREYVCRMKIYSTSEAATNKLTEYVTQRYGMIMENNQRVEAPELFSYNPVKNLSPFLRPGKRSRPSEVKQMVKSLPKLILFNNTTKEQMKAGEFNSRQQFTGVVPYLDYRMGSSYAMVISHFDKFDTPEFTYNNHVCDLSNVDPELPMWIVPYEDENSINQNMNCLTSMSYSNMNTFSRRMIMDTTDIFTGIPICKETSVRAIKVESDGSITTGYVSPNGDALTKRTYKNYTMRLLRCLNDNVVVGVKDSTHSVSISFVRLFKDSTNMITPEYNTYSCYMNENVNMNELMTNIFNDQNMIVEVNGNLVNVLSFDESSRNMIYNGGNAQ